MGRTAGCFVLLLAAVAAAAVLSVAMGPVRLGPDRILYALTEPGSDPVVRTIVVELRLPRTVLSVLVGAGLGAAGAAYQALFRNPLADPFVVGASHGAALGATLAIVGGFGVTAAGFGPTALGAFVGALGAVWLSYGIAAVDRASSVTLLLAGAAVGSVLGGAVWLVLAFADRDMPRIVGWLLGGLSGHGWAAVHGVVPPMLGGLAILATLGRPLDALACGEETALALGLRVGAVAALTLAGASLVVAAAVAAGGVIGFVGLVAPHVARPLVGATHARIVPASALTGAALLTLADVAARTVAAPTELPLGVVTSVLGGPVFLVILRTTALKRARGGS